MIDFIFATMLISTAVFFVVYFIRLEIVVRAVEKYLHAVHAENLRRIDSGQSDDILQYREVAELWQEMMWDLRKWKYSDFFPNGY